MVDTNLRGRKLRKAKQRKVKQYMELREDLQLEGRIPTTAEGAIRNERVDPNTQGEQLMPKVVETAVRRGWATPEEAKPKIVDAMVEIFTKRDTVTAPDGSVYEVPPDRYLQVKTAQVLANIDKMQYERDNPKDESGGDTNVNVNTQVNVVNWDSLAQRPQYVDPVDTAIQALPPSQNNEPTTETGPDGGEQPLVAE